MTDNDTPERKYAKPPSLHPLTPDEALRAALQVDPEELKRLEREEKQKADRDDKPARKKK